MKIKFTNQELKLKFSLHILINHYTHLGYKKCFIEQSFRKAVLGYHSNVTIINPALTLSNMRFATKLLFSLFLKNNKAVFICYYVPKFLTKVIDLHGHFFLFNKWPSGLLTNPYTTLDSYILDLPNNYYPGPANLAVIVNSEPKKAFMISNEANKSLIPCFCFADSIFDLDFFSYWIPTNTKSTPPKIFYLIFISKLIIKVRLVKKKLFLNLIRKKLKIRIKNRRIKNRIKYKMNYKKKTIFKSKKRLPFFRKKFNKKRWN